MKVKLTNVRGAFLKLFDAEQVNGEGEARYGAAFVIDPKNTALVKELDAAMVALAKEQWKDKAAGTLQTLISAGRVAFLHRPKANQAGEVYDGFEDMFHLNASRRISQGRPLVLDVDGKTPLVAEDGKPYSGCYVNATVDLWAQDNKWGKRINATLLGVQFLRDGDSFSGGAKPSMDDFEDVTEGATADDLA